MVGVYNIPESTLLKELQARQIPIPPKPRRRSLPAQSSDRVSSTSTRQRRRSTRRTNVVESYPDAEELQDEHRAYVAVLRSLLVERLKLEEEYERLQMYSRDTRFDSVDVPTKLDLGRVILDMLHCPMRMNEKVLFMLYYAAMNRLPHKRDWEPVLDSMTNIVRRIGDLSSSWSHTYKTKKSKTGAVLNHKLEVFHMDYEASKQIFNYANTEALYEVIDLAVGTNTTTNANWRFFIISYLNCLELLTLHRDYQAGEVDELERRCKKMYQSLVTKIGGIEGVTNYFHYLGSGHVVWMCRKWGNLWRYRNEGVEAFNKIVSLRHNTHNGNGGRKRTRVGEPIQTCPEFWSLGQWLGRWSMWQLGYGDDMDPDRSPRSNFTTPAEACDGSDRVSSYDTDDAYTTETSSDDESLDDVFSVTDDDISVASVEFIPCTPLDMTMLECRALNLLQRRCVPQL